VPKVRGPEQSRSPAEILNEVKQLVDQGVKEITFIGQTVNSYKYQINQQNITTENPQFNNSINPVTKIPNNATNNTENPKCTNSVENPKSVEDPKSVQVSTSVMADQNCVERVGSVRFGVNGVVRLSDLLYMSSEVRGLCRIKFVTNYPLGMDDDLLLAVRDLPKVSKYFHIPVQSGSNGVLKRMGRHYTVGFYCELVDKIRVMIPGAAITSDFIVGFCGETEAEFLETVALVRHCRFKNSFVFKYSERSGTKSAELYEDDVPDAVKKQRNNELLLVQDEISLELNRQFIGSNQEILVEGVSKNYGDGKFQLSGRTSCDRIVVFDSTNSDLVGQFINVNIYNAAPFTLFGNAD
jgi:tRNA-2-methylthio-N6-dimethylallyladenosine synthase